MSSTTSAPAAQLNGRGGSGRGTSAKAAPLRVASGKPRTPPAVLALCLLLMLGCGAGAGALVLASESAITVVAAARDLPAGTVISAADLRSAELAGSGLAAIPGERAGTLLGKTVLGPVPAGTLLNAGMVASSPAPAAGKVAVGLALTAAQLPAPQLAPGRMVTIFQLPDPAAPEDGGGGVGGGGSAVRELVRQALVLSVQPAANGFLVSVEVGAADAAAVSVASSLGRASVGLLPLGAS